MSKKYRALVKGYKQKAKERYALLKVARKARWRLPLKEQFALLKKDRKETKAWKTRILKLQDPVLRKAQKKGYKYFKKLQHRKYKLAILIAIVLWIGLSFASWVWTATRPLTAEQHTARVQSLQIAEQVMDEGMVLLRNEDETLPLKNHAISVFGAGAANPVYGGGGAGGIASSATTSLFDAFNTAGISYDKGLFNVYSNYNATGEVSTKDFKKPGKSLLDTLLPSIAGFIPSSRTEMPVTNIPSDVLEEAVGHSDTALYVVSRSGTETIDFKPEELKLSKDERATIELLNNRFEHVVVLLNTTNAMELGFVEELENIDAVLWVGAPGEIGVRSIANALTGEVTPSGRLTDTYAYEISSNPAVANTGDFQYVDASGEPAGRYFVNNLENIYVGYRYYDTFISDAEYDKVVQYPFGYGLSYTNFAWETVQTTANDKTITAQVKVTNTGKYAGKDVVQLYYTAPFTADGIEKPEIVLGGYGKSKLLAPGESDLVTVTFDTRSMASYDDKIAKGWVLDAGSYKVSIARDVRTVVSTFNYTQPGVLVIKNDDVTNTEITNRFDDARGSNNYLSRSYPDATKPTAPSARDLLLPEYVKASDYVHQPSTEAEPVTGAKNNIQLAELRGLDYDDPKWTTFLDQLTDKEMVELTGNGGYWTVAVDRLGVPRTTMFDGPASIRNFLGAWSTVAYPIPANLSATWNDVLAEEVGQSMGKEARSFDVDAVYAPSLNLHRSPLGGRNFEYYSEDPLIAGKIGAAYTRGLQSTQTIAIIKHYAANDQETNRARFGLYTWATEQSLRELYLKPFEIAVKEGDAHGAMSAFNRIGAIWAGGSKPLLNDVLRDEWGFKGFVITDAGIAGQGDHFDALQAVESGNDLMLAAPIDFIGDNTFEAQLKKYLKEDRAGTLNAMRSASHNILYYVLQTDSF